MMISSQRWDCEGIVDLASLEFGFVYMGDVELLSLYAYYGNTLRLYVGE
jgi:hypothetical protein